MCTSDALTRDLCLSFSELKLCLSATLWAKVVEFDGEEFGIKQRVLEDSEEKRRRITPILGSFEHFQTESHQHESVSLLRFLTWPENSHIPNLIVSSVNHRWRSAVCSVFHSTIMSVAVDIIGRNCSFGSRFRMGSYVQFAFIPNELDFFGLYKESFFLFQIRAVSLSYAASEGTVDRSLRLYHPSPGSKPNISCLPCRSFDFPSHRSCAAS